ncbi:Lap4 protein, partial [Globisporangium splendens]
MGCAASVFARASPAAVGPDPLMLRMMPATSDGSDTNSQINGSKRHLTLKHTPSLDNEPAQRLQSLVLSMAKSGKLELTSVVSRDGSTKEMGTLTKEMIPHLKQVPGIVFSMFNLTELNVRCNEITLIPKEIAMLQALEVLNVSENQLKELSREITQLSRLKTLEIAENHIKRFPDEIGKLTKLETLRANRNRLVALPNSIKHCTRIKTINLYNNVMMSLGSGISELSELEELNVSNNMLVFFPEVKRWKNLKRLYLQVNRLTALPAFDALCNLELFTVQQNALQAFPNMDNLVHLKKLDANTNHIPTIPPCFQHMTSLVHLNMRKTLLTHIPAYLSWCKCLEILDLGDNPMSVAVPVDLVTLPNLKTFLIDGTKIAVVPIELMGLRNVVRVNLGSCLRMDDPETCEVAVELQKTCTDNGGWLKTG